MKRSAVPGKTPPTEKLELGEIAINTYDGLMFIKKDNGTPSIVQIGGVTSVNTATGAVVLGTDEVAEGSSNLYFTTARARSSVSAGTGITYNSSTGVISTTQNLSTAGSPSFAGLTLTGGMGITGNIIPSANNVYSLGSADYVWKDVFVGPGTLYVNGSPVITDNSGTMTFTADTDQNIRVTTVGAGVLQLGSSTTNVSVDGTLQIAAGKNITSSDGVEVNFGDNIDMNSNKVVGLGAPSAATDAATKGYVDTSIGAISTSSITQGNSSVAVVDSGSGTVTVTVDGSTALTVDSTGVVVAGNFTVSGTTTTVNSNTVSVADNIITLNSDTTGTPTQNAGIEVERGDETNVQLRWNEGGQNWTFTNDGAVYHPVAADTDDLVEGSTNQYFTTTRARQSLSSGSATGITYNSSTGNFALGSIPNTSLSNANVSFNGVTVALGSSGSFGTDSVAEENNQYFTTARARGSVSAGGDLSYDSSTGVMSFTKPSPVVTVTMTGDVTGSASATLTSLASGTVSIATTIAANSVALGTDTTGNYVATGATSGNGISGSVSSEGGTFTVSSNATSANTASTIVYRDASGNFSAGTVTAALSGNASTASTLQTARTISLTGDVSGSVSFNGSADASITAIVADDSHNHVISNVDGLQAALDGKQAAGSYITTSTAFGGDVSGTYDAIVIADDSHNHIIANIDGLQTALDGKSPTSHAHPYLPLTGGTITDTTASTSKTTGALIVNGGLGIAGAIFAGGEVTAYASDAALKTNVVAIDGALAKVEAIRGVTYEWNEIGQGLGLGTEPQVGVIAQEIEAVLPQLVVESAHEGYKTVKYDKLTALLIEAVKELSGKVASLEAQLAGK